MCYSYFGVFQDVIIYYSVINFVVWMDEII